MSVHGLMQSLWTSLSDYRIYTFLFWLFICNLLETFGTIKVSVSTAVNTGSVQACSSAGTCINELILSNDETVVVKPQAVHNCGCSWSASPARYICVFLSKINNWSEKKCHGRLRGTNNVSPQQKRKLLHQNSMLKLTS